MEASGPKLGKWSLGNIYIRNSSASIETLDGFYFWQLRFTQAIPAASQTRARNTLQGRVATSSLAIVTGNGAGRPSPKLDVDCTGTVVYDFKDEEGNEGQLAAKMHFTVEPDLSLLALARQLHDQSAKAAMLEIASHYSALADFVERRQTRPLDQGCRGLVN